MLPLSNLGLHSKEQQWGRVNTKSYQEKQYLKRLSTYVWFSNHIKFSINLKIKEEHICAYNACTIQYSTNDLEECVTHSYGGSYLWTATFKKTYRKFVFVNYRIAGFDGFFNF